MEGESFEKKSKMTKGSKQVNAGIRCVVNMLSVRRGN